MELCDMIIDGITNHRIHLCAVLALMLCILVAKVKISVNQDDEKRLCVPKLVGIDSKRRIAVAKDASI